MRFAAVTLVAIVALGIERVDVGCSGQHIDIVEGGLELQFNAARTHLAILRLVLGVVVVLGKHILLRDLEHRGGQQCALGRLVLHPHFVLFTLGRFKRLARGVRAQRRQERLRIADVRRQTKLGDVGQADTAGELVVTL
ncbi:hypothetical protein D3C76_713420 [compost metagenome]